MQDLSDGPVSTGSRHCSTSYSYAGAWVSRLDSVQAIRTLTRPPLGLRVAALSLLAALLGVIWSQLVLTWTVGPVLPLPDARFTGQGITITSTAFGSDFTILVANDPFFESDASSSPLPSQQVLAPETTLDLKLYGVRAGQDPRAGSAIVRTPDKRQGSYRVGDTIMDGVELEQVLPDRIVISRVGARESLFLDPSADRTNRSGALPADQTASAGSSGVASIPDALRGLELRPRIIGSTIAGFYISSESDPAILRLSGLQQNDVVTSVNGVRLVNAERITDVIGELRAATTVEIQIERDGTPQTLTLNMGGTR